MKIRSLRVRGIDLRLDRPVETASGTMESTPLVLIDVYTDNGPTGIAYVRCYTSAALLPLVQLISNLEPVLRDVHADPSTVCEKLEKFFKLLGPQGLCGIAMAGIDMALWDVRAKAAGVPLVTFMGGSPGCVPAYASLRTMSPAAAASEAAHLVAAGFGAVKLKIGRAALADDIAAIRAVRAATGDNVRIMVDYNQSLQLDDALQRVAALDSEGVYWIEEPLRADDYTGHSKVAAAAVTPVQLGENCWFAWDVEKNIAARASDHIMFDVMKLGGVTGWVRAARLAAENGLPASSHTFPEISVHLLRVTPTAHYLEYLDHAGPILERPVVIKEGFAYTSEFPGSGIAWNERIIERQSVISV